MGPAGESRQRRSDSRRGIRPAWRRKLADWNFRVLPPLIEKPGRGLKLELLTMSRCRSTREEEALINPRAARKYLEYFGTSGPVTVFWGSAGEFLKGIERQLASVEDPVAVAASAAADDW